MQAIDTGQDNTKVLAIRQEMGCLLQNSPEALMEVKELLLAGSGKGLRGQLLLLCAGAGRKNRSEADRQKLLRMAAVIELLHLATLVHDDVIDDSPVRRGFPSIQAQFGKKVAVMAGDYLFTVCFESIMDYGLEPMQMLSRAMSKICTGEIMQYRHSRDTGLTLRRYLRIIGRKTAVLFACAAAAGAKGAAAKEPVIRGLAVYATYLGFVFQIVDDCLDYISPPALGKPGMQDIQAGVVTLPVLYALWDAQSREETQKWEALITRPESTEEDIHQLYQWVKTSSGVEKSLRLAYRYRNKGWAKLDKLPAFEGKEELYKLLDAALNRIK